MSSHGASFAPNFEISYYRPDKYTLLSEPSSRATIDETVIQPASSCSALRSTPFAQVGASSSLVLSSISVAP